jgi:hypothetical protein
MPPQNVEIVRSLYERLNQTGDPEEGLFYFDPVPEPAEALRAAGLSEQPMSDQLPD